jgi:pilus assembly protein CpaB
MRWSIVGLVLLGVIAAVCAAVLVMAVRASGRGAPAAKVQGPGEVEVVVAAKAMPALSVVDTKSVLVEKVAASEAPPGFIANPVQVIGKVLAAPMVEGQAFTPNCFATGGRGPQLAAALPKGMRAVCVSLAEHTGLEALLYPGSVVDVLASFRVPSARSGQSEALSTTLIQGVEVLAIEDETVMSDREAKEERPLRPAGRRRNITLLVTSRQATALQLAMEYGSLSLAMRNPLDTVGTSEKATLLSELSEALASREGPPAPAPVATGMAPVAPPVVGPPAIAVTPAPVGPAVVVGPPPPPELVSSRPGEQERWETVVIRGGKTEKQSFPMPGGGSQK